MVYLDRRQKMDVVLTYLKKFKDRQVPVNELNSYLQSTRPDDFTLEEISKALKKLLTDGCINNGQPGFYQVTLKGIMLLEDGGYNVQSNTNIIRSKYAKVQEASLYPWLWASVGLFLVYELFQYGYFNWHWKIPF